MQTAIEQNTSIKSSKCQLPTHVKTLRHWLTSSKHETRQKNTSAHLILFRKITSAALSVRRAQVQHVQYVYKGKAVVKVNVNYYTKVADRLQNRSHRRKFCEKKKMWLLILNFLLWRYKTLWQSIILKWCSNQHNAPRKK